jgi:DNA (cytosine-5)-methyltransferase 1
MDTTKTVTHISLCAGYGGIDLGLKRAIPHLRTIAFSEIEAFACANLVAKMEAGFLDAAPIWTDVKTFPWPRFHGKVDILSGGYPCQPFSAAGKRLGRDDPRHLWPWIADGIRLCQPRVCFFENVEGHISLGLREVLGELEEIGYRATWGVFSAAEVGAPHQRKRVFILAHRVCERGQLPHWWRFPAKQMPVRDGETRRDGLAFSVEPGSQGGTSESLHTGGIQCQIGRGSHFAWPSRPGQPQFGWEPPRVVGDADHGRRLHNEQSTQGLGAATVAESSASVENAERCGGEESEHQQANLPSESSGCGAETMADASQQHGTGGSAWTGRGEWSQCDLENHRDGGNGDGQTQPALGGNADGPAGGMDYAELCVTCDNRTDELRLLGNGVVPATAERAFRVLSARFTA